MYVGSVSKLWRYVHKALFCWEGWNVNNLFFENTVFYIRELTFLKVLKILIDGWSIYFKITRFAAVQSCLYIFMWMYVHVAPCQVAIFTWRRGKKDIVTGSASGTYQMTAAVWWGYAWCTLLLLPVSAHEGGQLHKYCDISCSYICGIALCWQSQSKCWNEFQGTALLWPRKYFASDVFVSMWTLLLFICFP